MYKSATNAIFYRAMATLFFSLAPLQANSNCLYETMGTTVPNTSGTPVVINRTTGTVISANFFDSGAISHPYFDGLEFVSVCINHVDESQRITAKITTDVGLDDDTRIKGYPQFVVGTKFGNQYETSFRYYPNTGLPPEQQWPVSATNLSNSDQPFKFANLQYVSTVKNIGLPAFTTNLPDINISLDVDEENVVGSERDVMLESWFYDTSANADKIGNNQATGLPIANTLNNIVGIGHPHYEELNNTLLEMMVHIGPLSPNDISGARRNPGQHQLTENYSGKDSDEDGIDDHFDVDSHVNAGNSLDPQPGVYSSGVDNNNDGIDDADILPITIGSYQYSIWYGESFLSPIVIFSRETNASLTNDFDPATPDMDLSSEGIIDLNWNEFLDYTLNELESQLQTAGVDWALGDSNPFPKMSGDGGAIGGVEFGIEPQINNPTDEPYIAMINSLDITVNGMHLGIADTVPPSGKTTVPDDGSITPPTGNFSVQGIVSDDSSGVSKVRVRLERLDSSPRLYWNGLTWQSNTADTFIRASLTDNNWSLTNVDLSQNGSYLVRIKTRDHAGNISSSNQNSITEFTVGFDSTPPAGLTLTPSHDTVISANSDFEIKGTASDNSSGVSKVRVRIERHDTSPKLYWNGSIWQSDTTDSYIRAYMTGSNWSVSGVDLSQIGDYRVRLKVRDRAGNISASSNNAITDFSTE